MESKEVDGMLLDRFTASYYQSRGKLKSLITVKKLHLHRDVGILFSHDRKDLARCLRDLHHSNILTSAQTFTATYKVMFATACHSSLQIEFIQNTIFVVENDFFELALKRSNIC